MVQDASAGLPSGWPIHGLLFTLREDVAQAQAVSQRFSRFADWVSRAVGTPWAFSLALGTVLGWFVTGFFVGFDNVLYQFAINTGTTIVTFLMVFLVQHTQNRDTRTLHLKLDELLTALKEPDSAYAGIEQADDRTLDRLERLLEQQRGRQTLSDAS
jgi:low affinity Fe/Cu permease